MSRLFFALWPSEEIRTQLYNVAQQFKNEKFNLTKKSNLHITLAFLGEVSDEDQQELQIKISKLNSEPFEFELTRAGWWSKPAILWIGTTDIPKPLTKLVKLIKKCVRQQRLKTDHRPYKPHVTIARKVKQITVPNETIHIPWTVSSFALVVIKSTENGVDYQVLQEWSLTK
ncbi:MAG: RNA 2',3'-cyclic phosphodiesterase [Proteobacteria bacterium]|nr:RNA 2',3'-cyclic phosphodiesterase [Pseudomonadota bacterium]